MRHIAGRAFAGAACGPTALSGQGVAVGFANVFVKTLGQAAAPKP